MTKHKNKASSGGAKSERHQISERRFWAQRLSKTSIRALHILGVAASGGGILYGVEQSLWLGWWVLAMITGCLMMALEIAQSRLWLIQLKGVLTLFKLFLLSLFWVIPPQKPALYITIILMSVIIAHSPAGLRHYSIWHRRRIDEKRSMKG